MFRIEYAEGLVDDLAELRTFDQRRVLDEIREQLTHQPAKRTRLRKPLHGAIPLPAAVQRPVWQLSVADYRVLYDVDKRASLVHVLAIRRKPPHKTTEEIL